jgi:Inner membrane protein YgaP-like, transmembrane domain
MVNAEITTDSFVTRGGCPVKIKYERNLGRFDRVLRAGVSFLMIYYGFFSQYLITDATARLILGVVGVLHLIVVIAAFCPLYAVVGFNTAAQRSDAPQ